MKKIDVYTDGSSLGNPGPGGYGAVMVEGDKIVYELGGYEKATTNNRMELKGVIETLRYLSSLKSFPEVNICADSAYVLGGVNSWVANWERNGWRTANKKPVLNQDLWQELIGLVRGYQGKLSWEKVKGHSGHIYNERADQVATSFSSTGKCELVK